MRDYLSQCRNDIKGKSKHNVGTPNPGEIWWVENCDGVKNRPVIIVKCEKDNVICLKCTSQEGSRQMIGDYLKAGLDKETFVEPVKSTVRRSSLSRKIGSLSKTDRDRFGIR